MKVDEWVEAYRMAWESRDPEAAAALFTTESSYRAHILEEPHLGREGVAAYWGSVTESQSEVTVRMGRPFIDGSRVAVEFWTTMRVSGDRVTLPGCLLLEFDAEGLCGSLREYWHFVEGHAEPPTGWGE
jgi:predicted SnoaL-like aldol condensation-catalyzing enzyme